MFYKDPQAPQAWHNDPQLKADTVKAFRVRLKTSSFRHGTNRVDYGKCLTGRTGDEISADLACKNFGLLKPVVKFLGHVYDELPKSMAKHWCVASVEAIPVGADLSQFKHRYTAWLLSHHSGLLTGGLSGSIARTLSWMHQEELVNALPETMWEGMKKLTSSYRANEFRDLEKTLHEAARQDYWTAGTAWRAVDVGHSVALVSMSMAAAEAFSPSPRVQFQAWRRMAARTLELLRLCFVKED